MQIRIILATCTALCLFAVKCTNAAVVLSPAGFGPTTVVDFSQFSSGYVLTPGPVQVGALVSQDIEWSSTYSSAFIGTVGYGLGSNGGWTTARNGFVGTNSQLLSSSMRFDFNDGPVAAVGGFVNYAPDQTGYFIMEALDIFDNVLETFDVGTFSPISTPFGTDMGAFRGFLRGSADIAALRLTGSYSVLDDLTFSQTPAGVPEPYSIAVWVGLGLAICGWQAANRKLQVI